MLDNGGKDEQEAMLHLRSSWTKDELRAVLQYIVVFMNVWKHFKSTDISRTAASAKNAKERVKLGGDDVNAMYGSTVYRVIPVQNKGRCILLGGVGSGGSGLKCVRYRSG